VTCDYVLGVHKFSKAVGDNLAMQREEIELLTKLYLLYTVRKVARHFTK